MARKKSEATKPFDIDDVVDAMPDEPAANKDVEIVKIENVGPISYAEIPIPKVGGGVLVLRGDSGTGKSEAIDMIDALITKDGKLMPRYLAAKGQVSGFDLTVNVGGTTTRKGDTAIATLDASKFTFADLVDPPLAGMVQRHARRIQALIGLSGVEPDLAKFLTVVGGQDEYDKLLTPAEQKTRDPVALAGKIKDAIESKARDLETLIANDIVNVKAAETAAKDLDLTAPHDAQALQDALVEAANRVSKLNEQADAYKKATESREQAKTKLAAFSGKSADRLVKQRAAAKETLDLRNKKAGEQNLILQQIAKLQEQADALGGECERLDEELLEHAEKIEELEAEDAEMKKWQAEVDANNDLPNPSEVSIQVAQEELTAAREAVDLGGKIRTALEKKAEAKTLDEKNKKRQKYADTLRQKAANVFQALSEMIPKGPLYVVAGELVVDTADRKAEPYELLSTGERWFLALPYAITAVGDGGYICCPQDAWQHLSPTAKPQVAAMCEKAGVWLITGEVTTGELRAEVFQAAPTS
jgi:hypothetical protein